MHLSPKTFLNNSFILIWVFLSTSCSFRQENDASNAVERTASALGNPSSTVEAIQNPLPTTTMLSSPESASVSPTTLPLIVMDCTAGSSLCPELSISGDSPQFIPGYGLSNFRGFADPSIRQDPLTGRLWMAYSYPNMQAKPAKTRTDDSKVSLNVDIHLAHSDDGGLTWQYDRLLWAAESGIDPGGSGEVGFSSHEVISFVPALKEGNVTWYAAHLSYFITGSGKYLGRRTDSFHFRITQANSPPELATSKDIVLAGALTAPGWDASVNLSKLSAKLRSCLIWNEPALFFEGDTLYLAAVCLSWDIITVQRQFDQEQIALFATQPSGDVTTSAWRYVGKLAGPRESLELGGSNLVQVDLAHSQDGKLLMIVSPNHVDSSRGFDLDVHHGCRALQVESLEPPMLARDRQGSLKVLASITASDLESGPGACGYDPASATGILFVRRIFDFDHDTMVWSIHATGIHP